MPGVSSPPSVSQAQMDAAYMGSARQLWSLIGADMNSSADQAFAKSFNFTRYRITEVIVTNASTTLAATLKTLAVRNATGGGGTAIVNGQNLTALVTPDNMIVSTILSSDFRNDTALYARLSALTGVAGTADIYINGYAYS